MTHKVPSTGEVVVSLRNVIKAVGIINSQRKLRELVLRDLRETDPAYTVSGVRLRCLALEQDFVIVEIKYRETDHKHALAKCPVCGGNLKKVQNKTIFDGTVTVGFECEKFPYWTGIKRRVPTRYIFTSK